MGREKDAVHAVLALEKDLGGVLPTGIFSPCWDTSHTGPGFSVISMRPSGRKASRQGSLKVATVVMVKGIVGSGFCSPALTWVQAATDAMVKSSVTFSNVIVSLLGFQTPGLSPGRYCSIGRTNHHVITVPWRSA